MRQRYRQLKYCQHISIEMMLFGKSIEYALKGGAVDFTGNEDIDYWETIRDEVRVCNISNGC